MINVIFSNKNFLIGAGLLSGNSSISIHSSEFESAVQHFNSSMNLSLDVCDLSEQLDNVSKLICLSCQWNKWSWEAEFVYSIKYIYH